MSHAREKVGGAKTAKVLFAESLLPKLYDIGMICHINIVRM